MTTKTYVSVNNQAKNIRKAYCSVNGQAKPIKRIYASVGGQAKIIYDTVVVSYVNDSGYINNSTISSSERIARHSKATKLNNKHWYKSDGTEWNFDTAVDSNLTLYEAAYVSISATTFDGSHYVQTDIKPKVSNWDCRGSATPTNIGTQRRIFSVYNTPVIEMYINGSGYWNVGVGNNGSSVTWSAASNKVKATVNHRMSFRFNLSTSSTKYLQIWQDNYPSSNGNWSSCTAINQSTTANNGMLIGYSTFDPDAKNKPFIGTIETISWTGDALRPYKRNKGGSTVQGFVADSNSKFYALRAL